MVLIDFYNKLERFLGFWDGKYDKNVLMQP